MTYEDALKELVSFAEDHQIPRKNIVVGGSLAMVMHGIPLEREIGDIDVEVTEARKFFFLEDSYGSNVVAYPDPDYGVKQVTIVSVGNVDVHVWAGLPTEVIEGFQVWSVDTIVAFKRRMGRVKDFDDIMLIENWKQAKGEGDWRMSAKNHQ